MRPLSMRYITVSAESVPMAVRWPGAVKLGGSSSVPRRDAKRYGSKDRVK